MTTSPRSLVATARRLLLRPLPLAYLALVAAVVCWVLADHYLVAHADASMAGVWIFFSTAPVSLAFAALPTALFWIGPVVGALVNALVLGVLAERFGGRGRSQSRAA
ncbi:SCO4225 family membrane protein [Streptomyces sp. NPDC088923]|uniref:SCO4225 family membrane protein n=1 Tax=Streptomyces sp. NPDC088923 TaxID=3365913 RepID=UPI00381F31EC